MICIGQIFHNESLNLLKENMRIYKLNNLNIQLSKRVIRLDAENPTSFSKYINDHFSIGLPIGNMLKKYKSLQKHICKDIQLSDFFIQKHSEYLDWRVVSRYQKMPEYLIERFKKKVYWDYISKYQKLSENFMMEHERYLIWRGQMGICKYQKMSMKFIDKFYRKVSWGLVTKYQKLSEQFIEKHSSHIPMGTCWQNIFKYQNVSEEFKSKYKYKIEFFG